MKTLLPASLVALLLAAFSLPGSSAEPFLEKIDLFENGDLGYQRFHIPGIVVTAKGTVLAWCEARKNGGDWDEIDILLRRSTDDGRTWNEPENIAEVDGPKEKNPFALELGHTDPDTVTYNNPVLVADRDGTVHMLFCLEYMRCFYQRSDDDGRSWSRPVEITETFEAFRGDYDWKVLATGPNHGIQLRNGRLLVPVWLSTGTGGNAHRPSVTATIYSDDGGETWEAGDIAVPCTEEFVNPNETVAVELADGRVMLNARNESKAHRRLVVTSPDGAADWSEPRFDDELLEPICMAGLVRYEHGGKSLLLFSNPHNLSRADGKEAPGKNRDRKNVTVHLSEDEGASWPVSRSVEPGWSAYSDIGVTPEGTILCFHGRGEEASFSGDRLTVARFNLEWLLEDPVAGRSEFDADVCVYGGTSGGVVAALQAARMGKKVVLLEPGRHLGGMTSGGLSAVDIGEPRSVGGIAREYFTRLVAHYGKELDWGEAFDRRGGGGPAAGGAYSIEPHVAERVFDNLIAEAGVTVLREARLESATMDGAKITELHTEDGRAVRAGMFIDTTYEGDLVAAAGVSYTVRREGNAKYGESYNGIHYSEKYLPRTGFDQPGENGRLPSGQGVWDRDFPLDPWVVKGDPSSGLLPLVSEGEPGIPGEPAPGVQAYCFRLCLTTDEANQIPIAPPPDYDPDRYELVARFVEACLANGDDMDLRWFSKHDPLPNHKWDFNTATFGGNLPGLSHAWPEASYDERERLAKELENYHRGLFHFLRTDPRVPEKVKRDLARFGLPKDEFVDNGGWPHQVYIREGRRMVGDLVMTEYHTFGREFVEHSVGLGSYGTDAHEIRRIVKDGVVAREGKIATGRGGFGPYQIGYGAIVPKREECENLFATFALSASHTAFASIRMEPPFMVTSQSAATAACLALDEGAAVQAIDFERLEERLLADGQVLEWKGPGKEARPRLSGIVIDETEAEFTGEWTVSNAAGSLAGSHYRHDGNTGRGEKSATFSPTIERTGNYEVRLLYSAHENRASRARVVVRSTEGEKNLTLNQRLPATVDGAPRSLGVFRFEEGRVAEVTLSNADADGYVSVDGLQLVPVPEP
ncbi:MAG: FAD-dependent oxidoreductase [Verrucomicrobiales bacterium]